MALTDKLTAIANAIRAKTGKSGNLTLDQMATEISKISTGGGLSTLDKTVIFKNGDDTVLNVSVKNGYAVGKPTHGTVSNWKKSDNTVVTFPFTPTDTETTLYGISKTYADMIYDAYSEVNRETYPYVCVCFYGSGAKLSFYKTASGFNFGAARNYDMGVLTLADCQQGAARITEVVIANKPSDYSTSNSGGSSGNIDSWYYAANYTINHDHFVSLV